jgi:hypothetical protein
MRQELDALVRSKTPLVQVVEELRAFKDRGVTKDEMYHTLEILRQQAPDETAEDRILEVMDFVSGFCSEDKRICDQVARLG